MLAAQPVKGTSWVHATGLGIPSLFLHVEEQEVGELLMRVFLLQRAPSIEVGLKTEKESPTVYIYKYNTVQENLEAKHSGALKIRQTTKALHLF